MLYHPYIAETMNSHRLRNFTGLALIGLTAACGGESAEAPATDASEPAAAEAPAATAAPAAAAGTSAAVAPDAGGEVIEIEMTMTGPDGKPAFVPAQITAQQGDVLRFVNKDNVHNVRFTESSAGAALPPASPYLTQPGETWEMKVDAPAGTYEFVCDPHLAMGMVGELTVTQ